MKIIKLEANQSGSHPALQDWNSDILPKGYAVWPDHVDTSDFYTYNGFVTLDVEQIAGVDTVAGYAPNTEAWNAWKASLPPEPDPEPTPENRLSALEAENKLLRAKAEALAEQNDFQEELIVELANIVYA